MNLSFSPPVKIVAAFGAILVVVAGAGSMLLGKGGSGSATKASVRQTHLAVHKTTTASGATKTSATKTTTKKSVHGTTTVQKHVAVTTSKNGTKTATKSVTVTHKSVHHTHKAVASGNLVNADLPAPLQWQLARHHIVVVSFYDPQSDVDSISVAEAHAGATVAGAGFLLVNVLDNSLAGPLTALLPGGGLLPDPGVLIYRSPGTVAYRLDGFSDRDAVAQAVANAFAGQNGTTVTATSSTTVAAGVTG